MRVSEFITRINAKVVELGIPATEVDINFNADLSCGPYIDLNITRITIDDGEVVVELED